MFPIQLTVRDDALAAFEASLAEGEDRDETLALLIGLEHECRQDQYVSCDGTFGLAAYRTSSITVAMDPDTYEVFQEVLLPGEDPSGLVTALMLDAVQGRSRGPVRADALFAVA